MAVVNSFAKFFAATYPAAEDVVNTAANYGDSNNDITPTYNVDLPAQGDVRAGITYHNGGLTGLVSVPSPSDVLLGVAVDQITGVYRGPSADTVKDGTQFGAYDALVGNVLLPIPSNVLNTAPDYDSPSTPQTGTADPGAGGTVPSANDVRFGVPVGSTTGLMVEVDPINVRSPVTYDAAAVQKTGTAAIPSPSDVRLDVAVDATVGTLNVYDESNLPPESRVYSGLAYGDSQTGAFVSPAQTDVREGTTYGYQDEYSGTLVVGAGTPVYPAQSDVRLGSPSYGTEGVLQFTGNVRVPSEDRVENGYEYDANDSLTGSLSTASGENVVIENVGIIRGDDYTGTKALIWELSDAWPDLAGATVKYGHGYGAFEKAMAVTAEGVTLSLTKAETAAMRGDYWYDVQATLVGGAVVTLARGQTLITETDTDVPTNDPINVGWVG